jgi:hypothetical protein
MTKIKVFSAKTVETHNVSISLFGEELTLKQVFNNQSDIVKNQLWDLLLNLYIQLERINNNNVDRINNLKDGLKKMRQSSANNIKNDIFKKVIKSDVNETTNNMLDDIIGSFQSVVSNKGNPFDSIMGITEMITSKYGNKIENGEIEIDKILGGMGGLLGKDMGGMGGMGNMGGIGDMLSGLTGQNVKTEEPVIIDDNFSTANIDVGVQNEEKSGSIFNLTKLMPLADMVNKIGSIKSEDDINVLKKEMDNFMEKELKVDMNLYKENMDKLEKKLEEIKLQDVNNQSSEPSNPPTEQPEQVDPLEQVNPLESID